MKTPLKAIFDELFTLQKVKNQFEFGNMLGYTSGYITEALKKDNVPSKMQKKLNEVFNVSMLWISTGGKEGEMFSSTQKPIIPVREAFPLGSIGEDEATETTKSGNEFIDLGAGRYVMLVPKVHEYAYGGYLVGYRDPEYLESLPKHSIVVNEKHRGKYCSFEMRGDSMDNGERNAIEEGDTVTGRSIAKQYWNSKLHIHKYKEYIIVAERGILVKQIIAHEVAKGIITIHSYNPDKISYPDDQISLAEVKELFNVIEVSKPRK